MSGKDDRSKDNRKNMKQHKYYHKQQQQQQRGGVGGGNTSSSSPQTTAVRSLVDVADSSDEPRFGRKGWNSGTRSLAPQQCRDMPTDTEDVAELGVDGAPMDENARAQLRAGDYKQMSQFPSLGGGHFSFGAEKEWNNIAEGQTQLHTKSASSYFTLNLSLLNAGLQTIPFYKRMDYPTNMFTRRQIVAQTEAAERAERSYQERILRESNGNVSASKSRAPSAKSIKELPPSQPVATSIEAPDELDELLALTNTQLEQTTLTTGTILPLATPVVQPATPTSASKNEVEQWLDSVLDE
ncbi:uncharacterized protein LOC117785382 [Drosophila innubila]|uniref:uncharacterized protein LOC117785382 n=1 Tax=Drosophila innubila TaxID=198719 RepID=UPI00148D07C3|nr:uncharacterized protein LOC117785382 [Drosophila innubila]XP_034479257.1 uncharacterized protein LOC117785382 [Drosophila innubila]XP_034479266.1 uncharacterized protein LOC117785382 [Drosophila innubila]